MSTFFDNDVLIHHIAAPGLPGDGMTAPEATALRNDINTLLGRPVITKVADIPDVDLTGMVHGDTLIRDSIDFKWKPGRPPGTIDVVRDTAGYKSNVKQIRVSRGLELFSGDTDPEQAWIVALFGSAANTIAEGNHAHAIRVDIPFRWSASGSHSSGTRTLTSGTVTGLDPAKWYIVKGTATGVLRGEGTGAGFTLPRITINTTSRDAADRPRTVAGVQVPFITMHQGIAINGVSSVSVECTLAYSEGDPIYVGGGELMISVTADR